MADKREQLERTATNAVQRSGLSHLSFRRLADEVGIKSSSVHYHFPDKPSLTSALIARYSESFAASLQAIEAREDAPAARLDALVDLFAETLAEQRFCLCGMLAAEVERLTTANRAALVAYFQNLEQWVTRQVTEADGGSKLTPATLARSIISGLQGAILLDRVDGKAQRLQAQRMLIADLLS